MNDDPETDALTATPVPALTAAQVRRCADRRARYISERNAPVNRAASGARDLAETAVKVSYLDGKIDALTDVLELAEGED